MKLYTREQMIQAFDYGKKLEGFDWIGDMIDSLTPIELPRDEEIQKISKDEILYNDSKRGWWIEGAKWVVEQIKQQDK